MPGRSVILLSLVALGSCRAGPGNGDTRPDSASPDTVTGEDVLVPGEAPADSLSPDAANEEDAALPLDLTVMTFNVLCSVCDPAYDPWEERLGYQADLIARHDPDLIGLQEFIVADEVHQYLAHNPGYGAVYYRNPDMVDYPDATILYREALFAVVETGWFWLSPTPDEPYSVGFAVDSGQIPRLVVWALMERKSDGRRFYFANTHFDPNDPSQEKSGPLVYERFADKAATLPLIFTGDFNTHPGEPAYENLVAGVEGHDWRFTNAFDIAGHREVVTNQDPEPAYDVDGRIDHILLAGGHFSCPTWRVDLTVYGVEDRYPSDHFAVSAVLTLP